MVWYRVVMLYLNLTFITTFYSQLFLSCLRVLRGRVAALLSIGPQEML
jgi:hypothetical protein